MKKIFIYFKRSFIIMITLMLTVLMSCKGCKKVSVEKLDIPFNYIEVNVGESMPQLVNVTPKDAESKLKWSIVGDAAKISDNKIVGVDAGIAKCVVTDELTGISAEVKVLVSDQEINKYPVVLEYANPYGNVDYSSYAYYSDTGLYKLPEVQNYDGYYFLGWTLNGVNVINIDPNTTGTVTLVGNWSNDPSNIEVKDLTQQLCVGESINLVAKTNTGSTSFNITSDNSDVISVDENGKLTGVSQGRANITISSTVKEGLTKTIKLSVYNVPESISYKKEIGKIYIGRSATLNITSTPARSSSDVVYTVSDPSVLSINEKGALTPLKAGVVTVKATSLHNSELYVEQTIEVLAPASSVEVSGLNKDSYYIGDVINLNSKVLPNNVSQNVIYEVSNSDIASITEDGVLTITGRGELTVVVRSEISPDITWKKTIECLHELLEEENSDVKYIICCPGEDASTTICINYHAMNTKTSIEYTLKEDSEFKNFTTVIPDGRYFEEMDEKYESPFPARNIFYKEINGLTPGTEYIFRINCGDGTYSDTYNFKTGAGKGNDCSFLWLSDNHYHNDASMEPVYLYSEDVIKSALNSRDNLAFVFDTGDMIDRGGAYAHWDQMFTYRETLKSLPLVSTPGNHELYMNSTGQTDIRFHTAYNAQPKNGPVGKVGTSCFFIYNDVLFIMWDSAATNNYDDQLVWLEEVLRTTRENNSARLIVIGTHKPVHSENASYAIQDRDPKVMALCDKYSVDLVLTGHYHSQLVTPDYYGGTNSTNPLLGTNYLIGNSSRKEGVDGNGYIIDVIGGNKFKVNYIDHEGKVLKTWEFSSKKEETPSVDAMNTSKEEIVNSFTSRLDEINNKVVFNWTNKAFGTLFKIKVYEKLRGEEMAEAYIINEAYTNLEITNLFKYYDGLYHVEFYFNDGTILGKDITIKRNTELVHKMYDISKTSAVIGLTPAHNSLNYKIKKYDVYVNGKFVETIDYLENDMPIETYFLGNLTANTTYTVEFYAIESSGNIMFTNEITFTTRNK